VSALIRMHCFPLPCGLACHPVPGILYWPQWSFKLRTAMQLYYPMFHGNPTPCGTSPAHCRLPLSHHRLSIHLLSVYRDADICTSLAVYLFPYPYAHVRRHCWSPSASVGFVRAPTRAAPSLESGACIRPLPQCSFACRVRFLVARTFPPQATARDKSVRTSDCKVLTEFANSVNDGAALRAGARFAHPPRCHVRVSAC
jgi:hypothetical protein